jgi:hypothetical protein
MSRMKKDPSTQAVNYNFPTGWYSSPGGMFDYFTPFFEG